MKRALGPAAELLLTDLLLLAGLLKEQNVTINTGDYIIIIPEAFMLHMFLILNVYLSVCSASSLQWCVLDVTHAAGRVINRSGLRKTDSVYLVRSCKYELTLCIL